MPDPDYYSMNTLTEHNLPWRRTVCGLHSISISIGYNRTCVHMCVCEASTVMTERWQVRPRNMHLAAMLNQTVVQHHEKARHTRPRLDVDSACPMFLAKGPHSAVHGQL